MKAENNEIRENIQMHGAALYLKKHKTLVIGDLQLGYEGNLTKQGVFVPRINFTKIKQRLDALFQTLGNVDKVIINGDVKHEFGRVSDQEWSEVLDVFRYLKEHCNQVIVVKGNHDVFLEPITKWEEITMQPHYWIPEEKLLIIHGHEVPETKEFKEAQILIIGHEHPAIRLREKQARHKFKCFLKGTWEKKAIIVQPSFTEVTIGQDILQQQTLSPFLNKSLAYFECWILADQPYYFGKVKDLENLD